MNKKLAETIASLLLAALISQMITFALTRNFSSYLNTSNTNIILYIFITFVSFVFIWKEKLKDTEFEKWEKNKEYAPHILLIYMILSICYYLVWPADHLNHLLQKMSILLYLAYVREQSRYKRYLENNASR